MGGVLSGCGIPAAHVRETPGPTPPASSSRMSIVQALPPLDGSHVTVSVVEVHYAPSEASDPHRHPCPVIGYVVAGAIRSRAAGGQESVHHAGDTFYEAPNGVHLVSANASATDPATLLAIFVCDRDGPLSVDVPQARVPGTTR